MSLFERIKEKRINLNEQTFSDRQKSDMKKLLNKNFGSKKKAKETAGEVIKDTAKKDVERYFAKSKSKSKGGGATTGGTKTINQSDISKQAKKFTKKINKKNINRPEGVIGDTYVSTDKKGNIRSAKKVNPTLKKSVSQVKADIEFKQDIQKLRKYSGQKGTGELSDKAPQKVRKFVKDTRTQKIKDLKLPDTSFSAKTKFSQKGFEKTLKTSTKGPKTGIVDPFKGSEITKGQANVKGLESKAFKKTQPKDVKLPKSFTDFSKKLKAYKTDVAKTSSSTPRTVTKKYKPTTTVKQSEVSKQAKDFTKKVNQARTKDASTNVFKRVTAATSGKKVTNSKGIGNKFRGAENKAARNAEIIKRGGSVTGGGKPPKPPGKVTFSAADFPDDNSRKIVKKVTGKRTVNPSGGTRIPRVVTKQTKALMSKQQTFAKSAIGTGMRKNLPTVYKAAIKNPIVRTAVKKGGIPAAIGLGLLSSPTVRKGVKYALAGGTIGAFAGNKDKKAVLGPKTSGKPVKFNLSPAAKSKSNPNKSKYTAGVYGRPKAYS